MYKSEYDLICEEVIELDITAPDDYLESDVFDFAYRVLQRICDVKEVDIVEEDLIKEWRFVIKVGRNG